MLLGQLRLQHQVGGRHRVGCVRGHRCGEQRVTDQGGDELPLPRQSVLGGRAARSGVVDQRLGHDRPLPHLRQHLGGVGAEEVHVGRGGDPREELLGRGQPGAEAYDLGGHEAPFRRPDVVLEPLLQRDVVGDAAQQGHGQVGVGVDQARHHQAAAGVDDLAGRCEPEELLCGAHRDDEAVVDGDRSVLDGRRAGLHGEDGPAQDQCLPAFRIGHENSLRVAGSFHPSGHSSFILLSARRSRFFGAPEPGVRRGGAASRCRRRSSISSGVGGGVRSS